MVKNLHYRECFAFALHIERLFRTDSSIVTVPVQRFHFRAIEDRSMQ
jgi:hypothetical protein